MSECVTRAAAASAMYISGSTDAVKSGGSWNTCTGVYGLMTAQASVWWCRLPPSEVRQSKKGPTALARRTIGARPRRPRVSRAPAGSAERSMPSTSMPTRSRDTLACSAARTWAEEGRRF